jgi:hypothetical protein
VGCSVPRKPSTLSRQSKICSLLHADIAEAEGNKAQVVVMQPRAGISDVATDAHRPLDSLWLTNITFQGDSVRPLTGAHIEGRAYAEGAPPTA